MCSCAASGTRHQTQRVLTHHPLKFARALASGTLRRQVAAMTISLDMGIDGSGKSVLIDLEELLATRLLVQGNSGSGKSHLLRRLLERAAGHVQQIVIDPEGDFVTLAGPYGHVVIEGGDYDLREVQQFAARIREHRASVVLSLEGLDAEAQMRCAATFLSALFDAPREHWYAALVVVDEAQLFAPAAGGDVNEEVRRASLSAMTNLMCRGRKRGLAGVIATQRLAKLAKNVAAEASNFLMGRTFLDIDMARAADLLGMERRQAEQIRDLARGSFLALGPAISRRPISIQIGAVETSARSVSPRLTPLPASGGQSMEELLFAPSVSPVFNFAPVGAQPVPAEFVVEAIAGHDVVSIDEAPARSEIDVALVIETVLKDMVADEAGALAYRSSAVLWPDFQVRCRMAGVSKPPIDAAEFNRRLACARVGIYHSPRSDWSEALAVAAHLPDDMLGTFMLIARSARDGSSCPSDGELARTYGTSSTGRVRRLLSYIEEREIIVCREDLSGKRSISIPALGWTTLPAEAQ